MLVWSKNMDFNEKKIVKILYKNWKNITSYRKIIPLSIDFQSNEWHKEEQWILNAFDVEKQDNRGFAIKDIKEWITSDSTNNTLEKN